MLTDIIPSGAITGQALKEYRLTVSSTQSNDQLLTLPAHESSVVLRDLIQNNSYK